MSEYVVSVNDKKLKVMLQNESQVSVDTREYNYNLVHLYGNKYLLKLNDKFIELYSEISKDGSYLVSVKGNVYETIIHSSLFSLKI